MPTAPASTSYLVNKAISGRLFFCLLLCHFFSNFVANYTFVF
nr:MAG TPA: hypothetical protein [Caudoviricetes sp.]